MFITVFKASGDHWATRHVGEQIDSDTKRIIEKQGGSVLFSIEDEDPTCLDVKALERAATMGITQVKNINA